MGPWPVVASQVLAWAGTLVVRGIRTRMQRNAHEALVFTHGLLVAGHHHPHL